MDVESIACWCNFVVRLALLATDVTVSMPKSLVKVCVALLAGVLCDGDGSLSLAVNTTPLIVPNKLYVVC